MTPSAGSLKRVMRILFTTAIALLAIAPILSYYAGKMIGPGILHPWRLPISAARSELVDEIFKRTGAAKEDFIIRAKDGVELRGWKVRPPSATGDWVLLFHGIGDNRTGLIGHAEFLLRHGCSLVMMDLRAQGESGGEMATYGWKERWDTVAITDSLYSSEKVRHLFALGVSLGAAIALQSAAVEPRIEAVAAEAPFANLREVTYDYAGLEITPWLGKTLFRPATISALKSVAENGGFDPDEISPEKAVAERAFPVLLICGTRDRRIPCRHAEQIYKSASGPEELWEVQGAGHAAALGRAPEEYESRVVQFFETNSSRSEKKGASDDLEDQNHAVVFVRAAARKQVYLGEHRLHDFVGAQIPLAAHQFHQPFPAVLFVLRVHRFGDSVGAGDENISSLHAHRSSFEFHAGEEAYHHPAFAQIIHLAIRSHHSRRNVPGVHVMQRAVRLIEQRDEHRHVLLPARVRENHVVQRFHQPLEGM